MEKVNYKAGLFLLQWVSVCDMCKAVVLSLLKEIKSNIFKGKKISPTSNLFKIFFFSVDHFKICYNIASILYFGVSFSASRHVGSNHNQGSNPHCLH